MAFDRDSALRNAEKALKLGRLDQAIEEYSAVVEHQPRDWSTANLLGDLYARAGQVENAIAQYVRIGESYLEEGFLPRASALFKKALKLRPDDEASLLHLGQIAARQGLLADARTYMTSVAEKRRARGDEEGADAILIEMSAIDPADVDGRLAGARLLARRGRGDEASAQLRELALDLLEKEQPQEAIDVLREAVHLLPDDRQARRQLVSLLTDTGQGSEAEVYLTRDIAGDDPAMLLLVARAELEAGRLDQGREDLRRASLDDSARAGALAFMREAAMRNPAAAFAAAEAVSDVYVTSRDPMRAIAVLSEFSFLVPEHVDAALKTVEICLEEGLDDLLAGAQGTLADAYAASGQVDAGRLIAEDLVTAAPDDALARERLARIYRAAGLPDPEAAVDRFIHPDAATTKVSETPGPVEAAASVEPVEPEPIEPEPIEPPEPEPRTEPVEPAEPMEPAEPRMSVPPEIDLTTSLDSLDQAAPPAPPALDDVFEGFRERARVEDAERAEAAFEEGQLAAALGQTADAERLYTEAVRDIRFRFAAGSALARLLRDQGRLAEAIEWFERASEAPAPDRDTGLALVYDLGDTLERAGELVRAMAVFMELQADAGDYRGISARIDRLNRAGIGG